MTPKIHFEHGDHYIFDRVGYLYETSDKHGAFFRRDDGSGVIERFGWGELHELMNGPNWKRGKMSQVIAAQKGMPDPYHCIWEESPKQRKIILNRWFFVCGVNKLYADQRLTLRPPSVKENYPFIKAIASDEWAAFCGEFGRRYYCSRETSFGHDASPTAILRWRKQVEDAGGNIAALKDHRGRVSKLDIDQESYQFIMKNLREHMFSQRHSGRETVEKAIIALELENERRVSEGLRPLETRARSALSEWISNFDKFEVDAGRKGLKFAKRKYAGVGKTERATRPGQTHQVDEWEDDARTIILNGPIREGLDQQTLDRLPRGRRWIYVVIDVATRYVVGLVIAATQNSESAIRALEMATIDKDDLARAAGAECSWRGFSFECVESDTGSAFRAQPTVRAVTESHATYQYPNVGEPKLRGVIERYFGTHAKRAMPYVPGRTFSNPQERGDYDTEGLACLTDDQLALIFIRYIVDVYHQSPHRGLFGETPSDALERLSGTVGLPPKLPQNMRRRAFGIRQERTVTARGIRFLGIDYNSGALQHLRRRPDGAEVAFYVDPRDIGTISVRAENEWLEVGCSVENFHGVKLVEWIEVGKLLRSRYSAQAELKHRVVFDALEAMRARASEPMQIMGILPQHPTAEDLARIDREIYWGLSVVEDDAAPYAGFATPDEGIGFIIEAVPDGASEEEPTRDQTSPSQPPSSDPDTPPESDDDGWWHGEDDE